MQNERPEGWWASTPKIVNGKFLVVSILPDGEETTSLFSLDELESHLTPVAADGAAPCAKSAAVNAHRWAASCSTRKKVKNKCCKQYHLLSVF